MNIGRLFRTVRYLRIKQAACYVYRRALQRTETRLDNPADVEQRPGVRLVTRPTACVSASGDFGFVFLDTPRTLDPDALDWHCADMSRLWRYNLHYFDYLLDETRSMHARDHLIEDWIANNPPGTIDAWEPYTVSLRIVNWIDYFLRSQDTRPLKEDWVSSLYVQAAWLERHIEYHILANHYLKNAVALVFAGAFFAGTQADAWLDRGLAILSEEVPEQILSDGGHFERSPMYHCIVAQDVLDVVNILTSSGLDGRLAGLAGIKEQAAHALAFLRDILHPDGDIPLFNDAALGIAVHPASLRKYGHEVLKAEAVSADDEHTLIDKPDSGYYGYRTDRDFILIDCGPVGPDYQPGHAHCDTLSFELSLDGRRVIVDTGVSGYDDDGLRPYVRSTAAHNTVRINDIDQSELWGTFRVGRRARPMDARLKRRRAGVIAFTGSHDGYRHLPQRIIHERQVLVRPPTGVYEVTDRLSGSGEIQAESYVHLHPDLSTKRLDGRFQVTESNGRPIMDIVPGGSISCETQESVYCPRFGVHLPNTVLVMRKQAVLPFDMSFSLVKIPL